MKECPDANDGDTVKISVGSSAGCKQVLKLRSSRALPE